MVRQQGPDLGRRATPWLIEGYGGIYAIWFEGPEDLRVTAYSALFEDVDGISLDPDCYQLYRIDYRSWLETPLPPDDNL